MINASHNCYLKIDDAHLSTSVTNAVEVNARIEGCSFAATSMSLDVRLWKTGFFVDYLQNDTTVSDVNTGYLHNYNTFVTCKNSTASTFYGEAFGQIVVDGQLYTAAVQSPHGTSLACGT